MAKPILVANWKNHPDSLEKVSEILKGLSKNITLYKKLNFFVASPLVYLETVSKKIRTFGNLAVQDIPLMYDGTYTGEISVHMLKSLGVRLSIIGHSERRALGETNEVVNHKIKNCLRAGIVPLLCVGEKDRGIDGENFEFIREQLVASLYKIKKENIQKIIIAYEPVWAIGKKAKDAMSPADTEQTVIFIKKVLTDIYNRETAERVSILYGGSVEPGNASAIFDTGIDGFLVGHSSLDAKSFVKIASSINI